MIKLEYESLNKRLLIEYKKSLLSTDFRGKGNLEVFFNAQEFKTIFQDYRLNQILFVSPENMIDLIDNIETQISDNKFDKNKLKELFKYDNKFQPIISDFFRKKFNFKTCFYCNRNFITNYEKDGNEIKSTFQLDHFYEKATYPYLALSFYNLIPCCSTCNSTVKNSEINTPNDDCYAKKIVPPNHSDFKFNEKVKFKTFLENENLQFDNESDISIRLIENYTSQYKNYIELFRLNERYEFHRNRVIEMINKRKQYPDSRIKELADLTKQTVGQVKKDLFGEYLFDDDLSNRPLAKLTLDIAEELGLI